MGAAVSRAGAHRTTPLATATLVLAANAPDIDVAAFAGGEYAALAARRGITHGVPALLVMPFLVAAAILGWDRWVRRRRDPDAPPARPGYVLIWAAVGLATHPALDWMNTYGMRWWLPFDGSWTYGDALFIIDIWLWLALGGAIVLAVRPSGWGRWAWAGLAALATALVFSRPADVGFPARVVWLAGLAAVVGLRVAGRPRQDDAGRRVAVGALALAAAYIGLMVAADAPARSIVRAEAEAAGLDVVEVMVGPLPADPFAAEVEIRTASSFVHGSFHWLRTPRVVLDTREAVPLLDAPVGLTADSLRSVVAAARLVPEARDYLVWSRYPYVRVRADGPDWRVRFGDARYDNRPETGGLAGVEVGVPGGGGR